MKTNNIVGLLFAACLGLPSHASEITSLLWKDVGPWTIRVVEQGKGFCEASTFWPGGTSLTLGFGVNKSTPRLIVSNPVWTKSEQGADFDLIVQFGTQEPWRVPSLGQTSGSGVDLRIEGRDLYFFEEMMGAQQFGIRFDDRSALQFELDSAFDALIELGSCQSNIAGIRTAVRSDAS